MRPILEILLGGLSFMAFLGQQFKEIGGFGFVASCSFFQVVVELPLKKLLSNFTRKTGCSSAFSNARVWLVEPMVNIKRKVVMPISKGTRKRKDKDNLLIMPKYMSERNKFA
jgi:hypothetical protein